MNVTPSMSANFPKSAVPLFILEYGLSEDGSYLGTGFHAPNITRGLLTVGDNGQGRHSPRPDVSSIVPA